MNQPTTKNEAALLLAEDAKKLSVTIAEFAPTVGSFVEVCYGPAPLDLAHAASSQPKAYIIFWLGVPEERRPIHDEWIVEQGLHEEEGVFMVVWLVFDRLDVIEIAKKQWGRDIEIPVTRVLS